MTFDATLYKDTKRKDLIQLVGDGKLSKSQLDKIAQLAPPSGDADWYHNRVRRVLRYWIKRKQNAKQGGAKIPKTITKFLRPFASTNWFGFVGGWKGYGKTWDLNDKAPFSIVPLDESLEEKWNAVMAKSVVQLIDDGNGNLRVPTSEEEAEQRKGN